MNMREIWYMFWSLHRGSTRGAYGAHLPKVWQEALKRAEERDDMLGRRPGRILLMAKAKKDPLCAPFRPNLNCRCVARPVFEIPEHARPAIEKAVWFGGINYRSRTIHGLVAPVVSESGKFVIDPKTNPAPNPDVSVGYRLDNVVHDRISRTLAFDVSILSDFTVAAEIKDGVVTKVYDIPKEGK